MRQFCARTLIGMVLVIVAASVCAAEQDEPYVQRLERQTDDTIRSACNGYLIDMIPDYLSSIKQWLDQHSPMCAEIRHADSDADVEAIVRRYQPDYKTPLPPSNQPVEPEPPAISTDSLEAAIRHIDAMRKECGKDPFCLEMRKLAEARGRPVSQADYDKIVASCPPAGETLTLRNGCIRHFFYKWPEGTIPEPPAQQPDITSSSPNSLDAMLDGGDANSHDASGTDGTETNSLDAMLSGDTSSSSASSGDSENSMDALLAGANESLDQARAAKAAAEKKARDQAELRKLEAERRKAEEAMEAERRRLIAQAKRKARREQEEAEARARKKNWVGIGIALAGGAALANASGMSSQGKLDFLTKYTKGVLTHEDVQSFQRDLGTVATAELQRQAERLKQLDAQLAERRAAQKAEYEAQHKAYMEGAQRSYQNAKANGIQAADPTQLSKMDGGYQTSMDQLGYSNYGASTPSSVSGDTGSTHASGSSTCSQGSKLSNGVLVGPASMVGSKFMGLYNTDDYPQCFWQFHADGTATWGACYTNGDLKIPVKWQPMLDKTCSIQKKLEGDIVDRYLVIEFPPNLPQKVQDDLGEDQIQYSIFMLQEASDGRIGGQFFGRLNDFYMKK